MKKIKLILAFIIFSSFSYGQVLKIELGSSISKLDWNTADLDLVPNNDLLFGHSVFIGIGYFNKEYFNISSNVGLIRKGAEYVTLFERDPHDPYRMKNHKAFLDYLSINSTIDIKYPGRKIIPFLNLGPRVDFLYSKSDAFYYVNKIDEMKTTSVGLILGGGLKYDFSKLQFGLKCDYYLNLIKVADWTSQVDNLGGQIRDRTITINLLLGYRLK